MAGLAAIMGAPDDDLFLEAADDEFGSLQPARRPAAAATAAEPTHRHA